MSNCDFVTTLRSTPCNATQYYAIAIRNPTAGWNSFKPVICYIIHITCVRDVMCLISLMLLYSSKVRKSYGEKVITKKWSQRQHYHQHATCYVSHMAAHLI
jgi:hypothetical protein